MDYLNIGSVPYDENCEQVPYKNPSQAKLECFAYMAQLRRMFGDEPDGCKLKVKTFQHDFGSYYEVVCYYEENDEKAFNYALKCEGEGPENWDEEAKKELGL